MTARYPLWCVDREGVKLCADEHRYLGPFDTEALAEHEADEQDQVRRCRRVMPSELGAVLSRVADDLVEVLNESACEGDLPESAWADFGDAIVSSGPDTQQAVFKAWLDAHLTVKAFICEGDEPVPGGDG